MVSLEQLDPIHRWVAHEFDCLARNRFGWCVKGIGVENLFSKRVGALKIITNYFNPLTLYLRSLPDRCLYGGNGRFWLVEIKALENRPNVAVEAFQLCLLTNLQHWFNLKTMYVFGRPDKENRLEAWICPVSDLPVERWLITDRFQNTWSKELQKTLDSNREVYFPNIPISYTESKKGSGDPYVIFSKNKLLQKSTNLNYWLEEQGKPDLPPKIRKSWEGVKELIPWGQFPAPEVVS